MCRKRLVPPNAYCSGDCDFSAEPTAPLCAQCGKPEPLHGWKIVRSGVGGIGWHFCSAECYKTHEEAIQRACQTTAEPTASEPYDESIQEHVHGVSAPKAMKPYPQKKAEATEPEVPKDKRCIQVEDGRQCLNEATDGHKVYCECGHNFIWPRVPDVPGEEQCQMKDVDGRRCPNRVEHPGWARCRGGRLFGTCEPDVPSEGEDEEEACERYCYAKHIRYEDGRFKNGWLARAAQAKRDTEELRAGLKTAKDLIDSAQKHLNQVWPDKFVAYKRAVGEVEKAGDA